MKWKKRYEIDVPFIDQQHCEWFKRVDQLGRAIEKGKASVEMATALKFVVEYTQKHFIDEQAYMQEIQYPGAASQHKLHKSFEKYIVDVLTNLKRGKDVPAQQLFQFMTDWMKEHILKEDAQIAAFVSQGRGTDASQTPAQNSPDDPLKEKLDELAAMRASDLITEEDFASKKSDMLINFAAGPCSAAGADSIFKLQKLKTYIADGLLAEADLDVGRQALACNVNVGKELGRLNGNKARMMHLKTLLDEKIINTEQFESHKAEILSQM